MKNFLSVLAIIAIFAFALIIGNTGCQKAPRVVYMEPVGETWVEVNEFKKNCFVIPTWKMKGFTEAYGADSSCSIQYSYIMDDPYRVAYYWGVSYNENTATELVKRMTKIQKTIGTILVELQENNKPLPTELYGFKIETVVYCNEYIDYGDE